MHCMNHAIRKSGMSVRARGFEPAVCVCEAHFQPVSKPRKCRKCWTETWMAAEPPRVSGESRYERHTPTHTRTYLEPVWMLQLIVGVWLGCAWEPGVGGQRLRHLQVLVAAELHKQKQEFYFLSVSSCQKDYDVVSKTWTWSHQFPSLLCVL